MTYVALLRGINVGGKARVSMPDLRGVFERLGHRDVRTYLQTGNVAFAAPADAGGEQDLTEAIRRQVASDLGIDVAVLLRTGEELTTIVAANPFLDREEDPTKLHVTFLDRVPDTAVAARIPVPAGESGVPAAIGREVYLHCPDGYGRTKLHNTYLEQKLGAVGSTRNWRTVLRLHEMATA